MTSIYQAALGSDFDRLHPQIQRRFGFSSEDGCAAIGRGVMDRVWHGLPYTLPFLSLGTWRRIMFPERGANVPREDVRRVSIRQSLVPGSLLPKQPDRLG